jgi:3,4-dihydroxy 2-butanone 4-phosphate synthase
MSRLDTALNAVARGQIVVLTGDRLRGGDIDFCVAARFATAERIAFMANHGRGLICLTLTPEHALRLGIALVNPGAARQTGRPFGRSIEAREGVSTGISAADRARTVAAAIAPGATADDLVSPGHVFPLISRAGGLRERASAVEGSIELCRRAGVGEAAVICSILRDDGEMARIEDVQGLIAEHGLAVCDIGELT